MTSFLLGWWQCENTSNVVILTFTIMLTMSSARPAVCLVTNSCVPHNWWSHLTQASNSMLFFSILVKYNCSTLKHFHVKVFNLFHIYANMPALKTKKKPNKIVCHTATYRGKSNNGHHLVIQTKPYTILCIYLWDFGFITHSYTMFFFSLILHYMKLT